MSNTIELSRDWNKVLLGLQSAEISGVNVRFLTNAFNEMAPDKAAAILAGGHYGDSSNEHREARNLFRAFNFLVSARGSAPQVNAALKEGFRYGGELLPELRKRVREACAAVVPPPTHQEIPTPVTASAVNAPPQRPVQATQATQTADAALAPSTPHFTAHHGLRTHFEKDARAISAATSAWDRARQDLWNRISNQREWFQFNSNSLQNAVNLAFQNFNKTVADDTKAALSRQELIKTLVCGAFALAPPPLSVVGKGISALLGLQLPDNYDPSTKYRALKGPNTPFFVRHMAGVMEEFETSRTALDLSHIGIQANFAAIASGASAAILKTMQEATESALDLVFGTRATSRDKLVHALDSFMARSAVTAVVNTRLGMTRVNATSVEAHERQFIGPFLDRYVADTEKQIKQCFTVCTKATELNDLRIAVELLLYSQYAIEIFDKQPQWLRPVNDKMIDFLTQERAWGIAMKDVDDHAIVATAHRLKWKDSDHHKKMLVMFCRWYLANINPFHMITGVVCNGIPYSAALIQKMCREHIDLINKAVAQGRTVNAIGWSSWDWAKITSAYDQARFPHWDDDTF